MVFKRRYIIWLVKAYIEKWGKIIILYFFLGLVAFFLLLVVFSYIAPHLPFVRKEVIGVVGSYKVDTIPDDILQNISDGLTSIGSDGLPKPGLAASWGIENNGKKYIFRLKANTYYSDGSKLTSDNVPLSYKDVHVIKPDHETIVFQLRDSYAPFLETISHPIFKKGFIGTGNYIVRDIKLNSDFLESLSLVSRKDNTLIKTYAFYPTTDALKVAFALGEVAQAQALPDLTFKDTTFEHFPNTKITEQTDYSQLVTLFYNTADKDLSDKKFRDALAYALPNTFPMGERAYSPFSPKSWAFVSDSQHVQDQIHAKLLLQSAGFTSQSSIPALTIATLPQYMSVANIIVKNWKMVGITAKIQVTTALPSNFQIYLGNFHEPKDPDQYTLWHSDAVNNITNYKNLRIDKLLEDGRKTVDQNKRLKIYADFQKYLLDDQPASFLYFPYSYTVTRK